MSFEKRITRTVLSLAFLLMAGAFFAPMAEKSPVKHTAKERYIPLAERYKQTHYTISPYDSLIRAWSDSSALDWRFVSAIVYHESHFRHDAISHRGAVGLMQMMPSTAAYYGVDSLLDASQNVMAGTRYLKDLYKSYGRIAANETERHKLTLAAYNAGGGRVRDLINYTRFRGKDPGYWENILSIMPDMRSDSILVVDTVKLGKFNGTETIEYVDAVMARYAKFQKLTSP